MPVTALYARVSSETQEKQQTIASQLGELRAFAEREGFVSVDELLDDGYSGTMLERPGLDRLRDCVAAGQVERVVCLCPDRLSRNLTQLGILVEEFKRHGVRLLFVNQQIEDSPEGTLLLQIQGAVSEYERTKIMDRTRRGKLHKAREGHPVGGGAAYGYRYVRPDRSVPGWWEIDEQEAEVVREIFRLFLEEGYTLRAIVRELLARGIPTRTGKPQWSTSQVHRVLTNEACTGTAHTFKTFAREPERPRKPGDYRRHKRNTHEERPREEWIPMPVPAIVDRESYLRAQVRLDENKRLAMRNATPGWYLLRGLLKCGSCGLTWQGKAVGQEVYYRCGGKSPLDRGRREGCPSRALRASRVEPVVWDAICGLLDDPALLLEQHAVRQAECCTDAKQAGSRRRKIERELQQVAAEEMRVVRLYREGAIDDRVLNGQLGEVRGKREHLERELLALADTVEAAERAEHEQAAVLAFCEDMRAGLEHATFEEKQQVLRLLVDRIEVAPDASSGMLYGVIPQPSGWARLCPTRSDARFPR